MKKLYEIILLQLLFLFIVESILGQLIPSCVYPPCRYNVYRNNKDSGNIVVYDASTHAISWNWEVKGGKWNVTYHYMYPDGWYEGRVTFINCSNVINGKEEPFVSWGSSKNWESNAKLIHANAWNISYNGDVFGFIPTGNGKYIFRVFTRNKRHNPFGSAKLVQYPGSCTLNSSDKIEIKMWWTDRMDLKDCPEAVFIWSWKTNVGSWRVFYKWILNRDSRSASVYFKEIEKNEVNIINWDIDVSQNLVAYKADPVYIFGESAWNINLSPTEVWGFSPTSKGKWIFQHFSRNLVFQPFLNG